MQKMQKVSMNRPYMLWFSTISVSLKIWQHQLSNDAKIIKNRHI